MAAGACLGDDTISALLEGGLAEAGARLARTHLAGCAACRQLVAAAVDAQTPASPSPSSLAHTQSERIAPASVVAGKYRVERVLGEGGMGRVFAARQIGLERPVAIKILRPELARDAVALKRFHREARLVAQLISEHAVRVHDLGELDTGEPYLVMELLEGEDLGAVVARGMVATDQAVAWLLAACDALAEAHSLGIVHRDIKPSNLFVTRHGRVVVLDFGLAKLAAPAIATRSGAMTAAGALLGSPHYMAPEQIGGARDVGARADVWSIGATLYHLVTGRAPYAQPTVDAVFTAILAGQAPSLAGIRPDVASVIQRSLARDPAARFATAAELAAALRSTSPGGAIAPARRRPLGPIVALVALAFLAGVGAVLLAWKPWQRAPAATPLAAAAASGSAGSAAEGSAPPPRPVVAPSSSIAPPHPAAAATSDGPLGNIDEYRVRGRLARLGWKVTSTEAQDLPGCHHMRFLVDNPPIQNADVYLLDCESPSIAASERARLRRGFPQSWIVLDASRLLIVMLPEEEKSKELAEALLEP